MTVRKTKKVPTDPSRIAAAVPAAALVAFNQTEDYRGFFSDLTDEVEEISGERDHGLTLRVAEELDIDPASWFKLRNGKSPA